MDVRESDILGDDITAHWYYRAKSAAMRRLLSGIDPVEILDIGAGSGYFAKELLQHTTAERAVCVDTAYPAEHNESFAGKPIAFRTRAGQCNPDLVLLMDVLEHVDDDRSLLRGYAENTGAGSHFLISVPALPLLWSGHDVFLEHKRRYTIASLLPVIRTSGLQPIVAHYYFASVLPLAATLRFAERLISGPATEPKSQLRKHGRLTNALLAEVCRLERPFMRCNRLAGLTVFALCRKT
jgi:SAM-dependent methyltransferase